MNIVLLGAPGSGKGLVSEYIEQKYGLMHISTGNLLRKNIKDNTELGVIAKRYIDGGNLLPDEIIMDMINGIISKNKNGIIFDGFPRTLSQTKKLDELLSVDLALLIEVPFDIVTKRALGRVVCSECAKTYNIEDYKNDICEACGAKLTKRVDDTIDTIKNRIDIYNKQVKDIKSYYLAQKKLFVVDNSKDKKETYKNLEKILKMTMEH